MEYVDPCPGSHSRKGEGREWSRWPSSSSALHPASLKASFDGTQAGAGGQVCLQDYVPSLLWQGRSLVFSLRPELGT